MRKVITTLTAAALLTASAVTAICINRNSSMDTILSSNVEALTYGESYSDPVWMIIDRGDAPEICVLGGKFPCIY